jgi:hypothetical protein
MFFEYLPERVEGGKPFFHGVWRVDILPCDHLDF